MTVQQRYRRKAKARLRQKATYDRWYAHPENKATVRERASIWAGTHKTQRREYQAAWIRNKRREALGLPALPMPAARSPQRKFRERQSQHERLRRWACKYNPGTLRLM